MTQENSKQLLLKDLTARLPYGVKIELTWWVMGEGIGINTTLGPECIEELLNDKDGNTEIKPYLFPLSSMTEEQKEKYCSLQQKVIYNNKGLVNSDIMEYVNWSYKNHIDINNLIPMGLAIDATELNIY